MTVNRFSDIPLFSRKYMKSYPNKKCFGQEVYGSMVSPVGPLYAEKKKPFTVLLYIHKISFPASLLCLKANLWRIFAWKGNKIQSSKLANMSPPISDLKVSLQIRFSTDLTFKFESIPLSCAVFGFPLIPNKNLISNMRPGLEREPEQAIPDPLNLPPRKS